MSHSDVLSDKCLSTEEHRFLARFLESLSREAPAAYRALLQANPQIKRMTATDDMLARIRAALIEPGEPPLTVDQRELAESLRRDASEVCPNTEAAGNEPGVLTSLTRRLSAEQATALYRKITPTLVYNLLNRLVGSAPLDQVGELTERLCSPGVQSRLREAEHVRDAILDEVRDALDPSRIQRPLSRQDLLDLLAASGSMNELVTMENCIKLARTKAG